MTDPLLELDDVTKSFGSLVAVDAVSTTIDADSGITALIGPNGAGKTTLYNVISGRFYPTSGTISFRGEDVTTRSPSERVQRGLGRSFQITNIFDGLTVRQNLRVPVIARSDARRDPVRDVEENRTVNDEVDELLALVGLTNIADQSCENLSYGDRRRVEIGISIATEPRLAMLDEPTAGMNPEETESMVELIRNLERETDTSFLVTEHDMNVVFSIADRIIVLNQGRIIADDTPENIQQNREVETAYLGGWERDADTDVTDIQGAAVAVERDTAPTLRVENIHTNYGQSEILKDVSLEVHTGEIVSILGRNGAGKTTTLRSIMGLTPPHRGEIYFDGERIDGRKPYEIARAGVGFVPEERRIYTDLTVRDNIELVLDEDSEWSLDRLFDMFPRLAERQENRGNQLSGGEQQMLTIARALGSNPDLLLLDEPSEGLAPVIVEDLNDSLSEIIETGMTVLLAEQNIEFALDLAERIYILSDGTMQWEGATRKLLDSEEVIDTYLSLSGIGR